LRSIDLSRLSLANVLAELASASVSQQKFDEAIGIYKESIRLCKSWELDLKLSVCAAVCAIYSLYGNADDFIAFTKEHRLLKTTKHIDIYKASYAKIYKAAGVIFRIIRDLDQAKTYLQKCLHLCPECYDASLELVIAFIEGREWEEALKKLKEIEANLSHLVSQGVTYIGTYSVLMYQLRTYEKLGLVYQMLEKFKDAQNYYVHGLSLVKIEEKRINKLMDEEARIQASISLNNIYTTLSLSLVLMKIQTVMNYEGIANEVKIKFASDLHFMKALLLKVKANLSVTKTMIIVGSPFYIQFSNNELRHRILEVFIAVYTQPEASFIDTQLAAIVEKVKQPNTCCDLSCMAILSRVLSLRNKYPDIIALKDRIALSGDANTLIILKSLGLAYYKTESYSAAAFYFEWLIDKCEHINIAHTLGTIYCMLGDFSKARQNFKIALKLSNGNHLYELFIRITKLFEYVILKDDNFEFRLDKLKLIIKNAQQLYNEFPDLYNDEIVLDYKSPFIEVISLLIVLKFIFQETGLWTQIKMIKTEPEIEALTTDDADRYFLALSQTDKAAFIERIRYQCQYYKENSPVFPDPLKAPKPAKEESKSALPQPGDEGVFLFKAMPADSGKKTYCYFDKDKLRKTISKENLEKAERLVTECERLLVDDGQDKPGVKRDKHNFFIKLSDEARIQGIFIMLDTYNIIIFDEGFGSHVAYEKARQEDTSQCAQK